MGTRLLAKDVLNRLKDDFDSLTPVTLKQKAKIFVESTMVCEYPKRGWGAEDNIPEHLWKFEQERQWGSFSRGKGFPTVREWRRGLQASLWRIHVSGISDPIGWVKGTTYAPAYGAYFIDGSECFHLAGLWENAPIKSRWQRIHNIQICHPTKWEATFALYSGFLDINKNDTGVVNEP